MPKVPRDRLAQPNDIWEAAEDYLYACSEKLTKKFRPRYRETFIEYFHRLKGKWGEPVMACEPLLLILIAIGADLIKPTRRDYLQYLSDLRDQLHRIDFALHERWPK